MNLLSRIIGFFSESFSFFGRVLSNTMGLLDEDLAVGLMYRLLFTPLFHDPSFIGRILSFFFRLSRIFIGLISFGIATILILAVASFWFGGWLLVFLPTYRELGLADILLISGLLIYRIAVFPQKRVPQAISVWQATKVDPKNINWNKLVQSNEVRALYRDLELANNNLTQPNIVSNEEVVNVAFNLAKKLNARYITEGYFWLAFMKCSPNIDQELLKFNLTQVDLEEALCLLELKKSVGRKVYLWDRDFSIKHLKGVNRGWLGAPTPNLDSVSADLTAQAARDSFNDFIGRKDAVRNVVDILSAKENKNVLLVGPAGVGKSSLVYHLAKLIVGGNAPVGIATKRLVKLNFDKLISEADSDGVLAERINSIFSEVEKIENIIVWVDEIQNLYSMYQLMLPHLESNAFQFIASTEADQYARIVDKEPSFARLFVKVELQPASEDETLAILEDRAISLDKEGLEVTFLAIKELVKDSRLIHDLVLPDSALSLLNSAQTLSKKIDSKLIKEVVGRRVNVPVAELGNVQKEELLNLEELIHQKLIDQEEAVKAVADTLRRGAVDLRDKQRPIGSFLFIGPTGVGKTELAKVLAETYFKDKETFIRFDMSEYQSPEALDRLLGTVDKPGELTEAVKNKPYCLLLLDEFEKADPRILTLFLQVLDDGRLTSAWGETIDFTNTIIIATSNAASVMIAQGLERAEAMPALEKRVHEELLKIFKPELLNRFDKVVIFKPLSQTDLQKIVVMKLEDLKKALREQGYVVDFSPELVSMLAQKGFDPVLGARPMRRYIQDTLEANLSRMILESKIQKGQTLSIGVNFLR